MKIKTILRILLTKGLLMGLVSTSGCMTSQMKSNKPALTLVEPMTKQFSLDDIPEVKYTVPVQNEQGEEEQMEFVWPWYVAIGGKIMNETAVFERAAAGQIDQSMVLGMATRKYFMWSAHRAGAVRVANRDQFDWNEIRKILMEVAGEGTILPGLTPLPPEIVQSQVLRQNIPPELFITGGLTEVTVGEESVAAGLTFAGIGGSGKIVQTSVSGTLEITDPYTGELVVCVMAQHRVTAEQVGAEGFRIVSFGGDQEYLNVELSTAREMIKQQVQVELVDYLFYKAFKELIEQKSGYLTNRLHYRVGRVQGYAKELAARRGLTVIGTVVPVPPEAELEIPEPIIELFRPTPVEPPVPETGEVTVDPNFLKEADSQLNTIHADLQRMISGLEVRDSEVPEPNAAPEGPTPETKKSESLSDVYQKLVGKPKPQPGSNEPQIIEASEPDATSEFKSQVPKAKESGPSSSVLDRLKEVTGENEAEKKEEAKSKPQTVTDKED
jgi:hypothetical protein